LPCFDAFEVDDLSVPEPFFGNRVTGARFRQNSPC